MLQHRASIVRAVFGVALLTAFWLFWPGPRQFPVDRHGSGDQPLEEHTWAGAGGLVTAARAGIAVSAKGQLVGEAKVDRLEARLRKIAGTIPAIGLPTGNELTVLPKVAADPEVGDPVEMAALSPGDLPGSRIEPPAAMVQSVAVRAPPPARPQSLEGVPEPPVTHPAPAALRVDPPDPVAAAPDPSEVAGGQAAVGATAVLHAAAPDAGVPEARLAALAPIRLVPPDVVPGRRPAWLQNAVAPVLDDRPAIAVVIDDLGVSRRGTEAVNRLKAPLTLSFLPYAKDLGEQTRAARGAGHELMLHVPMEPVGGAWPGPDALLSSLEPAELVTRLRSQLDSFGGFVGVNNHMGSLLTTDHERMALVMAELRRRDLLFLDSRTTSRSVAAKEAARHGVPHAIRDVFLDSPYVSIEQQLAQVEQIAARRGVAVAIGHPHDKTIEALREWLPTLDSKGFALVPISAVVARAACADGVLSFADACARYTATASLDR